MMADDSWNSSVTTAKEMNGMNNGPNNFTLEDPRYYSMLTEPTQGTFNQTQDYNNVFEAINFLKSFDPSQDEPFFLFLPLLNPYPPYSCPEPFYSMIDPDTIPPLRATDPLDVKNNHPDYHALIHQYRNLTSLDEAFWKKLHSVYLGSIAFSDFLFGELMSALDDSGLADNTVVTVFSDHGDYAGDYGLVEKWPSGLEDVLTRVPLIIRAPGGVADNVHKEQVQLFDIVPTMLEFAEIEPEHVHFGVSLRDNIMNGVAGDPSRAVFAEGGYGTNEPRDFEGDSSNGGIPAVDTDYYPKVLQEQEQPLSVCRSIMVRTLEYKLVLRTDVTKEEHDGELYNLQDDPRETNNLYYSQDADVQAVKGSLKDKIFYWLFQTSDVTRWDEDDRNGDNFPWPPRDQEL